MAKLAQFSVYSSRRFEERYNECSKGFLFLLGLITCLNEPQLNPFILHAAVLKGLHVNR